MDNIKKSIDRAIKSNLQSGLAEDYVSFKIKPLDGRCCCFHCWPNTWNTINELIKPYGPLEDEGDVLIGDNKNVFVLECHESGPEIIVYLGVGIATLNLIKSIIDIIVALIKNRQNERPGSRFKITKRSIKGKNITEEEIIEIDFPMNKENINILNDKIKKVLQSK
jgi:hypothetical protein